MPPFHKIMMHSEGIGRHGQATVPTPPECSQTSPEPTVSPGAQFRRFKATPGKEGYRSMRKYASHPKPPSS